MPLLFLALLICGDIASTQPDVAFQQPQIASDGKNVGIIFGSKDAIYFASPDSTPVRVADVPGLSLGNHRGPRIAFAENAIVVTAGVGPAGPEFGPNTLRSWRSTDQGKTWGQGADVSTPATGGMGFQAIASDGKRQLWAAWIGPQGGHPTFFVSQSNDAGLTWSKQRVLSQTVCECCHPNVTISADGTVVILFRNSLAGNRDLYLAKSKDGADFTFAKLGQGSWKIDACPMDGGGLGELDGSVVTVWRREAELFLARPDGKPEESLGRGRNASITLRPSGYYAVWTSSDGVMIKVPNRPVYVLSKTGAFPVITARGPIVAAWEDNGKIRTSVIE